MTDTGGEAEWIETLPKRGYRLVVDLRAAKGDARPEGRDAEPAKLDAPDAATTQRASSGLGREAIPYVLVFLLLALGTAAVLWNELFVSAEAPEPRNSGTSAATETAAADAAADAPLRLAVLPFADPEVEDPGAFNRSLTEAYVTALVASAPERIVVIGPVTTAPLRQGDATLAEIAAAVDADFVLHGGHRARDSMFFVEVVHPDGAHLYARRFELPADSDAEARADLVAEMTASILEAASR